MTRLLDKTPSWYPESGRRVTRSSLSSQSPDLVTVHSQAALLVFCRGGLGFMFMVRVSVRFMVGVGLGPDHDRHASQRTYAWAVRMKVSCPPHLPSDGFVSTGGQGQVRLACQDHTPLCRPHCGAIIVDTKPSWQHVWSTQNILGSLMGIRRVAPRCRCPAKIAISRVLIVLESQLLLLQSR